MYQLSLLPKSVETYSKILSAEVVNWHHDKHHAGYVAKLNEIEDKLVNSDKTSSNANYSEWGELKRRQSFNHAGIVLHENYWSVLGREPGYDVSVDKELSIYKRIVSDFGSFENWASDFIATGKSSLGWVLLVIDNYSGKLVNVSVDMHNNGAYWDSRVLIACDVFEHAYYRDYGPDRAGYLNKFVENIDWKEVENIYNK